MLWNDAAEPEQLWKHIMAQCGSANLVHVVSYGGSLSVAGKQSYNYHVRKH